VPHPPSTVTDVSSFSAAVLREHALVGSRLGALLALAEPSHDAKTVQACLGPLPAAGFFAQGEIGPIGGRTFLHGFTASIALFERA